MQSHRSVYSLLGLLSVDKTVHSVVLGHWRESLKRFLC
jgi:hypothetical protein